MHHVAFSIKGQVTLPLPSSPPKPRFHDLQINDVWLTSCSRAFFFGCLRRTAHNNLNSDIDSILISFRLDESDVLENAVE